MQFRFVLALGMERSDWLAFYHAYYHFHTFHRIISVLLRIICVVLGCLMLAIVSLGQAFSTLSMGQTILLLVSGCLCWAVAICLDRINVFFAKKRQFGAGKETVVTIDETGVTGWLDGVTTLYEYSALQKICYTRACYLLFLDKERALVLPERCREGGSSPELKQYLEDKTGLSLYMIS